MIAVLGAAGQVGGMVARNLLKRGEQVRAVVRDAEKAKPLREMGAELFIADYLDADALKTAFRSVCSVLLLTPETPFASDWLTDVRRTLDNYRAAVLASDVKKIVLLSSMGAQHSEGTGNLLASHMLEQAFSDLPTPRGCIRPAYYYSNWMGYLGVAKESGVLPTFFPSDLQLPMIAPADWYSTLLEAGFSESGARNLADMTQAVIDGKTVPETRDVVALGTDFAEYLRCHADGGIYE